MEWNGSQNLVDQASSPSWCAGASMTSSNPGRGTDGGPAISSSFFGDSIEPGESLEVPPMTTITHAALADGLRPHASATLFAGSFVICHLARGRSPSARLRAGAPLTLSVSKTSTCAVQLVGVRVDEKHKSAAQPLLKRAAKPLNVSEAIADFRLPESVQISRAFSADGKLQVTAIGWVACDLHRARSAIISNLEDAQACLQPLLSLHWTANKLLDALRSLEAVGQPQSTSEAVLAAMTSSVRRVMDVVCAVGRGPMEQAQSLICLDRLYFDCLHFCQTALDPPLQIRTHREAAAGSGASDGADEDGISLLCEPGTFFLSSHPRSWVVAQQSLWKTILRQRARPATAGSWLCRVIDEQRRLHDMLEHLYQPSETPQGAHPNELLLFWYARQLEAAALLRAGGLADPDLYNRALPPSARGTRDEEPPAPPIVQEWRHADREQPCDMLSFAVPSPEAVALLAKHTAIVEMGAGMGYWAALLHEAGCDVTAFDAHPPDVGGNEYHRPSPTFVPVLQGTPEALSDRMWASHALLLCYPPPRDPMALHCLRHFCGDVVAHVGEWLCDTGSLAFERELFRSWELQQRLPLPSWGDTADDLTIWRRRKAPLDQPPVAHSLIACGVCGAPALLGALGANDSGRKPQKRPRPHATGGPASPPPQLLRRCRYCRLATYCSAECEAADAKTHAQLHAVKMIATTRPLEFFGRDYYELRKPYIE